MKNLTLSFLGRGMIVSFGRETGMTAAHRTGGLVSRSAAAGRTPQAMAEREGFEPSIRAFDVYSLSRRAPSTTRPPLRMHWKAKPLPAGIVAQPPAEYDRPAKGLAFAALPYRDAYAGQAGHVAGWPAASDGSRVWLTHCYGMVGVGRNMAPDTGTGAELYTVIGHAPRHLDRNIATVGRVLAGMDALSALARGDETNMGFYKEDAARPVIASARIAADLPAAERPRFELLRTDRPIFAAWVKARANRKDDFFIRPAGGVDICNVVPPVREVTKG
jgi:cyclophilin family peptidyl-prolyl cis-trans isomerase